MIFKQEEMIIEPGNVEESDVDNRKKIFEEYGMKPIAISTLEKLEKEYGIELLEKAICIMGENNKRKRLELSKIFNFYSFKLKRK